MMICYQDNELFVTTKRKIDHKFTELKEWKETTNGVFIGWEKLVTTFPAKTNNSLKTDSVRLTCFQFDPL